MKKKIIIGRNESPWFLLKEGVKMSGICHRLSVVCGNRAALFTNGYGASVVARNLHRWLCMTGIATSLMVQ
jgi:hypothetical protein